MPHEVLERAAASVRSFSHPPGAVVLARGGAPAPGFFVIASGEVELVADGVVADVLGPGEAFGFPSMLSGTSPTFDVRARSGVVCYLIPSDVAQAVFGSPSGLRYLARSLRARADAAGAARPWVAPAMPVGRIEMGPVVAVDAGQTIAEVARRMTEAGSTSAVVRGDDRLGIVTDEDVRSRVVAGGVPTDQPIASVMTSPARTVDASASVGDVVVEMVDGGIGHVPVVDQGGELSGVVSASDLLGIARIDPAAIGGAIRHADSIAGVVDALSRARHVVVSARGAGLDPSAVSRLFSSLLDVATRRLIALSTAELGDPPVGWTWLALGSLGRREAGLASDQDHTLLWEGGAEHDAYFAALAERVVVGLELGGVPRCPSGVMATTAGWRGDLGGWLERLASSAREGSRDVFRVALAVDHRPVAGALDLGPAWRRFTEEHLTGTRFLWRLARLVVEAGVPLGAFGRLRGSAKGGVDLKAGGLLPVVGLARLAAIGSGVHVVDTRGRLQAAKDGPVLDAEASEALVEAFDTFSELRLDHQLGQVRAGLSIDDLIDPDDLDRMTATRLREAFRIVAEVQQQVGRRLGGGRIR